MYGKKIIVALLWWGACALAVAGPASEAAVKELLAVTQARQMLDGMQGQMDAFFKAGVQQGLQGKTPNARQQQAIDRAGQQLVALMGDQLAWDKLEPMYLRLYQAAFTDEEVADMLAFYRTPAGQAMIRKMPFLMQQTLVEVQKMMAATAPRLQQIQRDLVAELRAAAGQ